MVVDDASGSETTTLLATARRVRHLRLARNMGAACASNVAVGTALAEGADWVWMMDDGGCAHGLGLAAPLIVDSAQPARLAVPLRLRGRTRFTAAEARAHGPVRGFAHLFNGSLVRADTFGRAGLPDPRLAMRGDEVEFLRRVRRARIGIMPDTEAPFSHPGSEHEIFPIAFGWFYAVVPASARKPFYTFRNRAWIFSRSGPWHDLAFDVVRCGLHYLACPGPDLRGLDGARVPAAASHAPRVLV